MKLILLSAKPWAMADEKTGEMRSGVVVHYSDGIAANSPQERGIFPMKISAGVELWGQLGALPGVYECDLKMRPSRDGKASLTLLGVKFVESLSLASVLE
jgi:hypothetical protein